MVKLEDLMRIGSSGTVHGLTPSFRAPTMRNKDIGGLITALSKAGIVIKPEDSEKTVTYTIQHERKNSTVPLATDFGQKSVTTLGYTLRGEGVELTLRDYFEPTSSSGNRIGGSYTAKGGIECRWMLEGKGETNLKKGETINQIVEEFYRSDENPSDLKNVIGSRVYDFFLRPEKGR